MGEQRCGSKLARVGVKSAKPNPRHCHWARLPKDRDMNFIHFNTHINHTDTRESGSHFSRRDYILILLGGISVIHPHVSYPSQSPLPFIKSTMSAARERRERRAAKMTGSARLDKITQLSGRAPESGTCFLSGANANNSIGLFPSSLLVYMGIAVTDSKPFI